MTLLDSWMPTYDVSARYAVQIAASPTQVYSTLLVTDFGHSWLVRGLMGARLLPGLFRSPGPTWRRLVRPSNLLRPSLARIEHFGFVLLEASPPREIIFGITGRFWTLSAEIQRIAPDRFRDALSTGLAQAVWNFRVTEASGGAELSTETRVRCADVHTFRQFRRYWRLVAPGSGLIRHAILRQVRREAMLGAQSDLADANA